jgi:DNA-binding protein HU-beta
MNKQELVEAVKAKADIESTAAADRAVKAVLEAIQEGVKQDGSVQLIGFGTFSVKERGARDGRNPLTGEKIKIAASKSVGFKAGASFKELVAAKKSAAKKAAPAKKGAKKK